MRNTIHYLKNMKLLSFDIETARIHKDVKDCKDTYTTFRYKNRDKVTEELLPEKEVKDLYKKIGGLSPIYGRIVSVSFSYRDKKGEIVSKAISGDEKDILKETIDIINSNISTCMLIGHNINRFDIPFLRIRCDINGINFPKLLSDSGKKPWEVGGGKTVDTMELFRGSFYNNFSLDELCLALNVPTPKGSLIGSQVSDAFHSGRIDEITEYNNRDTECVLEIIKKLG